MSFKLFILLVTIFMRELEAEKESRQHVGIIKNSYRLAVKGESEGGYYVTFAIGTPPQKINLLIDTGSSNFAVAAASNANNSSYFKYKDSKTFHQTDISVSIHYTEGSWSGFLAVDQVLLCQKLECNVTAQLACITSSSKIFLKYSDWQGVLGLAYPAIAKPDNLVEPFFNSLVRNYNINNVFSLSICGPYLSQEKYQIPAGDQLLVLGDVVNELYYGDIITTPVKKEWYYEVMMTDLKVGNKSWMLPCSELNNDKTIIDTGTSHLSVPKNVYIWIVDEIKEFVKETENNIPNDFWNGDSAGCVENVEAIHKMFPSLTLTFYHSRNSTFSLIISPLLYLQEIPKQSNDICFKLAMSNSSRGTIIGAMVLKGFYVIFDRQKQQIGFANSSCARQFSLAVGSVQKPVQTNQNLDCEFIALSSDSVKILAYVMGLITIVCAVPLLFMLVKWIWKHLIKRHPLSSETSSLVGDD